MADIGREIIEEERADVLGVSVPHTVAEDLDNALGVVGEGPQLNLNTDNPYEIVEMLAQYIPEEGRRRLAELAYQGEIAEVDAQYVTTFTKNIAQSALKRALGLKPLPQQQEQGEQ